MNKMTMQFKELVKRGEISAEAAHNLRYGESGIHARDVNDLYNYIKGFIRIGEEDACQKMASILGIERNKLEAYANYLSNYVSKPNTSNSNGKGGCLFKPEAIQELQKRNEIMDGEDDEEKDRLKRRSYLTCILNDSSFEKKALELMTLNPELKDWMLVPDLYTDFDDEIRVNELLQKQRELKKRLESKL